MNRLTPEEYYNKYFRKDFSKFIEKSNIHEHQDEGYFISIQELKAENLTHIAPENKMLFFYSLAFTVLIDMVVYAYFKQAYFEFQKMTRYPKIEYGITYAMVYPWRIAQMGGDFKTYENFSEFFIKDLIQFFNINKELEIKWSDLRSAMLYDKDVVSGKFGEIFKNKLEESV